MNDSCNLTHRYVQVRSLTELLASSLSPEDQSVQSMTEASPTKWHLAHTSWFFDTFVLTPYITGHSPMPPSYAYLFNSYYETAGPHYPRSLRGLISRPGCEEVAQLRNAVDSSMARLFEAGPTDEVAGLVELGLHHEQQHQELILMDIKHAFSFNPVAPIFQESTAVRNDTHDSLQPVGWLTHPGGEVTIGTSGNEFHFDNEGPAHRVLLQPFELSDRLVTCGEWLDFMNDGGYERPELWLSDGWANVQSNDLHSPLYWRYNAAQDECPFEHWLPQSGASTTSPRHTVETSRSDWTIFTLAGEKQLNSYEPVCHISLYEADAYARWSGARLPSEFEWEAVASQLPVQGTFMDSRVLHPQPATHGSSSGQVYGNVWEWTSSAYSPYPGFRQPRGSIGEYNGKFMVNQYVLRGGSCVTPEGHIRSTYRNFFPAASRWAFSGLRLARDH